MSTPTLRDVADMFNHNPSTASRGERSVSEGRVFWDPVNKVSCVVHGAMLCVNEHRTLWRCIACGAGAFVLPPDEACRHGVPVEDYCPVCDESCPVCNPGDGEQ